MAERQQFVFFRSYLDSVEALSKKDQLPALMSICRYALDGTEPEKLAGAANAVFRAIKPGLDVQSKKAEAGRKGGIKNRKQNGSKTESASENSESKTEAEFENAEFTTPIKHKALSIKHKAYTPPSPSAEGTEAPRDTCGQIIDLYNRLCPSLPRVKVLSDARKKAIRARLNQGYAIEDFERLFSLAEASDFLRGGNRDNWVADFDWLVKDSSMAKVLDGKYAEVRKQGRQSQNEVMTQRVQAGTAALGEHERAAIARMLKEGGLD